ncbi:MAG TPA: NrfD/PsrC family molybdoenzyme membrane anchor subunit, partial [Longimicrobiales bacterium]|nr:NrfD/PsrC family molybdoenzyme membrane anchor subunit [Longimicrobiales bacterium]
PGPIHIGRGRMAEEMVRTVYNVQHSVPWHWPVPAYLVTKGIAAGLFLILALGYLGELLPFDLRTYLWGGFLSLFFTGATTVLLVADLERPERFLSVLTRPQWRSWLVRGAYVLVAFSAVAGAWWLLEVAALRGWVTAGETVRAFRPWAFGLGTPLALLTAVYTAFLFGQAEGRDLWQSTLLPFHLVVQAVVAGGAVLLLADAALGFATGVSVLAAGALALGLTVDLLVLLPGELGMPHASDGASEAAEAILRGRYRHHFWWGAVVVGHLLPLGLVAARASGVAGAWAPAAAGATALIGLYLYEHAYVMAPQRIPNS